MRLATVRTLSASDWRLLGRATLLLAAARLALWLLPFPTFRRLLARLARPPRGRRKGIIAVRIPWAVEVASRYVPTTKSCLPQAVTAQVLLRREGVPSRLCIGVASDRGRFDAHAWVESGGRVVIGGGSREGYTLLTTLEGETS